MTEEVQLKNIRIRVLKDFALGKDTIHGPDHWKRVEENGLEIAANSEADPWVVKLFAALHDSKRVNESIDPEHGVRAAQFAKKLRAKGVFVCTDEQFKKLDIACRMHNKGAMSIEDDTIGACYDADRLDLLRAGIRPAVKFFSTEKGKELCLERFHS